MHMVLSLAIKRLFWNEKLANGKEIKNLVPDVIKAMEIYVTWWWGLVDWDCFGMWSISMEMIGCQPVEMWRWWGKSVGRGRKT